MLGVLAARGVGLDSQPVSGLVVQDGFSMKLALMNGNVVPASELRSLGFAAIQMFFGHGTEGDAKDPAPAAVDATLAAGNMALAAMTLHVDLVGPQGALPADVARLIRCVEKTAALKGRFGDNPQPILVWHPSGYPTGETLNDQAVVTGLRAALREVCGVAEKLGVWVAVEITRAGSIGSAESYLRVKDQVPSPALRICLDAANFCPDRTPLERATRMLGQDIVIGHGKDSRFAENGEAAHYGPITSGKLDYPTYLKALKQYGQAKYFVLEYYGNRDELLKARDVVQGIGLEG